MMQVGSVQTVLVCVPSQVTQAPCPAGQGVAAVQAYVISPAQASLIDASVQPFDYAYASMIWGAAFSSVVGFYFISRSIGTVLEFIRRG